LQLTEGHDSNPEKRFVATCFLPRVRFSGVAFQSCLLPNAKSSQHSKMLQRLGVCLLLWGSLLAPASAVKRNEFKTCAQSGFCRRLRDLPTSNGQSSSSKSLYGIAVDTAHYDAATGLFTANIDSAIYPEATLQLSIGVTAEGLARIKVDEVNGLRQRYNETAKWTLLEEPRISRTTIFTTDNQGSSATLSWSNDQPSGTRSTRQARITFSPLKLEFLRDGEVHVSFNEQNLFHMEHFRVKKIGDEPQDPPDVVIDEAVTQARSTFEPFMSEDGAWEETFNGFTDSKPKGKWFVPRCACRCTLTWKVDACCETGPEAYSFDITFPGYQHVFGIPQHASPLSLRTTRCALPYRYI
jgi:alpha 1,3-glucosidase